MRGCPNAKDQGTGRVWEPRVGRWLIPEEPHPGRRPEVFTARLLRPRHKGCGCYREARLGIRGLGPHSPPGRAPSGGSMQPWLHGPSGPAAAAAVTRPGSRLPAPGAAHRAAAGGPLRRGGARGAGLAAAPGPLPPHPPSARRTGAAPAGARAPPVGPGPADPPAPDRTLPDPPAHSSRSCAEFRSLPTPRYLWGASYVLALRTRRGKRGQHLGLVDVICVMKKPGGGREGGQGWRGRGWGMGVEALADMRWRGCSREWRQAGSPKAEIGSLKSHLQTLSGALGPHTSSWGPTSH